MILLDTETPQPGAILAMGEKEMSLSTGVAPKCFSICCASKIAISAPPYRK